MTTDGMVDLSEALADEIDRRAMTQREAAEQIGVSQQVLSRWLAGLNAPKREYVAPIARFLRCSQAEVREMRAPLARSTRLDRSARERIEALEDEVRKVSRAQAATLRELEEMERLLRRLLPPGTDG